MIKGLAADQFLQIRDLSGFRCRGCATLRQKKRGPKAAPFFRI
jgi:hypothetical protein